MKAKLNAAVSALENGVVISFGKKERPVRVAACEALRW